MVSHTRAVGVKRMWRRHLQGCADHVVTSSWRKLMRKALKLGNHSDLTESDSQFEQQSQHLQRRTLTAIEMSMQRQRRWSYETLAAIPDMAAAFRAFAFRALCQESVLFLEEIARYQSGEYSICSGEDRTQKAAFLAMVSRFITAGSPDEVNISGADKKSIIELSRADATKFEALDEDQKRRVFREAYVEVRFMLESNLLLRFTETVEFKEEEKKRALATDAQRREGLHGISSNSNININSSNNNNSGSGNSGSSNAFRDSGSKDCGDKLVGGVDEGQLQQQQPSLC